MNIGTAWVLIEESFHSTEKRLVSIISARRNQDYICDYIEQAYVDRFASINEKIAYKKNKKQSPFKIENYEKAETIISCGHDPMFRAYYCHKLELNGDTLIYKYRVIKGDFEHRISNEYEGAINVA